MGQRGERGRSLGQVVTALDERLFVGRSQQLADFRDWLTSSDPAILNVTGPGGMGKSALLRAFARIARSSGYSVVHVDGGAIAPTEESFVAAVGAAELNAAIERLSDPRTVVMLDTYERMAELTPFIQDEVLSELPPEARVVIASRFSLVLAWSDRATWSQLIRPMPLDPLELPDRREYVSLRGLADTEAGASILRSAGGLPLALSIACDLVLQLGVMDLSRAGEWREVIHTLVVQLMSDIDDPVLRDMLEVAAVVRQVDAPVLAEILGRKDISADFERLRALSMIRPADRGVVVHDEVRRLIREDMLADRPQRYAEIRERAHAYYRNRMRTADPDERLHLLHERLYLWEGAVTQMMMFSEESPGELWVEIARPQHRDEILAVWDRWVETVGTHREYAEYALSSIEENRRMLEAYLDEPNVIFPIVRYRDGSAKGFGLVVPVCKTNLELFPEGHPLGEFLESWAATNRDEMPTTAAETDAHYLGAVVDPEATVAVLGAAQRDIMRLWIQGGSFLACTSFPLYKTMLENCGFTHLEGATYERESLAPLVGYAIDVPDVMVEFWIDAILTFRPVPKLLSPEEAERAVQDLLLAWDDDAAFERSPVVPFVVSGLPAGDDDAALARSRILSVIADLEREARGDRKIAFEALRLAYLDPARISHERATEQMAVSRSTFYRLLRRAVREVAQAILPVDRSDLR